MTAPRWTPANRPPKQGEDVLVYLPPYDLTLVGWCDVDDAWYVYDQGWTTDVSHWRPLPPPPRVRKR